VSLARLAAALPLALGLLVTSAIVLRVLWLAVVERQR
jgi:hypothetical protein